jgi:hypothetical protein
MIQDAVKRQEKDLQLLCFAFWEIPDESKVEIGLEVDVLMWIW